MQDFKKKNLLFIYPSMMIGGSTTSLLSLLNKIDYNQYNVDLLLENNEGQLQNLIPKNINLLEPLMDNKKIKGDNYSFKRMKSLFWTFLYVKILNRQLILTQKRGISNVNKWRRIETSYDIAISFLEVTPLYYLVTKVRAKKKIAWVHVDYLNVKYNPNLDRQFFDSVDNIVVVSKSCLNGFNKVFPQFTRKTNYIENILDQSIIQKLAQEKNDYKFSESGIKLVTVARITFISKAHDRAVRIFKRLLKEGLLKDIQWHIIGDGPDIKKLEKTIKFLNLESIITIHGAMKNPHKFVKYCDMFFLPSKFEGKPMSITESQILGVPTFVTNYSSASEQVVHGVDGWIVENDEGSIYEGLKYILSHRYLLEELKNNTKTKTFSSDLIIERFYELIEK